MDDEERKILDKTYSLAKENNKILKELRAAKRREAVMRLIYWLVIIGVALTIFYYIQPYIENLTEIYRSSSAFIEEASEIRDRLPLDRFEKGDN